MESDLRSVTADFAGSVDLVRVDVSRDSDTPKQLQVRATPTLIGITDGAEVFRKVGRPTRTELTEMFSAVGTGVPPRGLGRNDLLIRLVAGLGLIGLGASTQSWFPAAIGAIVVVASLVAARR